METIDHQPNCACGFCADNRRQAALLAAKELPLAMRAAPTCSRCLESRKLADDALNTLRITREKYGLGDRHVMREKNRELTEAWHLLDVLCLNIMDDGPTWPRVLEWLRRNEQFRPENAIGEAGAGSDSQTKQ